MKKIQSAVPPLISFNVDPIDMFDASGLILVQHDPVFTGRQGQPILIAAGLIPTGRPFASKFTKQARLAQQPADVRSRFHVRLTGCSLLTITRFQRPSTEAEEAE